MEAIEIASIHAEAAVQPYLAARKERRFEGESAVELRFSDVRTFTSFRRIRSVITAGRADVWWLVRRWGVAGGDGGLDEAMCAAAARYLLADFAGLLSAAVVTHMGKRR